MSNLLHLLGEAHFVRLKTALGGTRLTIPKHYGKPPNGGRNTSVRLAALLGEQLAILLVFHFGDSTIYIPKSEPSKPVDKGLLRRLDRRGLSARAIAKRLGCTARTVTKHRARNRLLKKGL